jgi:hypothetical protein
MQKTRLPTVFAAVALGVVSSAASAEMSVATFIAKADALAAKGFLAMMSPDLKLLQGEMKAAGKDWRADIAAARARGEVPHSCPPQESVGMKSDEILAYFRTVPMAQHGATSVKAAFYAMMKKRYPCPQR